MSQNLPLAYVKKFEQTVKILYQNPGNLLRGTVLTKTGTIGNEVQFPVYSGAVASPRVNNSTITPMSPDVFTPTVTMEDFIAGDYTDIFRKPKVNFSEITELSKIAMMAIRRQFDQFIIDAAATSGTSNVIPAGGSNLTYEKCLQVGEFFDGQGVDMQDRVFVISAAGQRSLLQDDRFINEFYTKNMLVENGTMTGKTFLGMKFIVIPDFTKNFQTFGLPKIGNERSCFAWQKNSIGMAIAEGLDEMTQLSYIDDKFSWLAAAMLSANATAIDNIGIAQIDIDESA